MSGAAEQVEGLFKNYGSSGLLVLMTVGMEELAAFLIFECPCNTGNMDNFVYGMSYLLGPAIILFLIGLAYQVKILYSHQVSADSERDQGALVMSVLGHFDSVQS